MGRLDGKVSIVTASGSGMGEASAKLFAKEGAKVVVADVDPIKGQRVTEEIKHGGGDATFIEVDVSKVNDMERMVKTTVQTYGKLNILFNHAGIAGPYGIDDVTEEAWERCMMVNIKGGFFATKFAIPEMRKIGGGSIIFTASTVGLIGSTFSPTYASSKGAVVVMTKSLAPILAKDNIRVNCICPHITDTPMLPDFLRRKPDEPKEVTEATMKQYIGTVPMGRLSKPDEVAYVALFLASEEASYVSGICIPVAGAAIRLG